MPGHTCLGDGLALLEWRESGYTPSSKGVELKSLVTRAHIIIARVCALVCLCLATSLTNAEWCSSQMCVQLRISIYLGVLITSDSMWSSHNISNICNKTRRLVGLMYRKFYKYSSPETLIAIHLSSGPTWIMLAFVGTGNASIIQVGSDERWRTLLPLKVCRICT